MSPPDWKYLSALMEPDELARLRLAYELVGVPGLRGQAVSGLLDAGISVEGAARMSDAELLDVRGVGPVAVRRLRTARTQIRL